MAIRKLVYFPDKILRQTSKPVEIIDDSIKELAFDMIETMQEHDGVGLAAIQIAIELRIFVMDKKAGIEDAEPEPIVAINPAITWFSEEKHLYKEGCLSIPEIYHEIERPSKIKLQYYNLENEQQEIELENLLATCAQHELDHLNGLLFFDHLSKMKKDRLINKFLKKSKNEA